MRMRFWLSLFVMSGMTLFSLSPRAFGRKAVTNMAAPAPTAPAVAAATNAAVVEPGTIPLSKIVTEAEAADEKARAVQAELAANGSTQTVAQDLPTLAERIAMTGKTEAKTLAENTSLERLKAMEISAQNRVDKLAAWTSALTARAQAIDGQIEELKQAGTTWKLTIESAKTNGVPPDVLKRAQLVPPALETARKMAEAQRARVLTLQNQVVEQSALVAAQLTAVRRAHAAAVNRLFVKDTAPLWSSETMEGSRRDLAVDTSATLAAERATFDAYATQQGERLVVHSAIFLLLAGLFYGLRRPVAKLSLREPGFRETARVFDLPLATALLFSLLFSTWIYPDAPRVWRVLLGVGALLPTILILRRIIDVKLRPVLYVLAVFYLVNLLRLVVLQLPALARLLFLLEAIAGLLFLGLLARSDRFAGKDRLHTVIRMGARVGLVALTIALLASALGYVTLGQLIGGGFLFGAYLGLILYAAIRLLDGLLVLALHARPLVLLDVVKNNGELFRAAIRRVLVWVAWITWILLVLDRFSVRAPLVRTLQPLLTNEINYGAIKNLSLWNTIVFGLTVWLSFAVSKFIRFVLREDVYPRLRLAPGLPYAISTMLHYAVLLCGFLLALGALGLDLTQFTVLAGAFGVGLGFGLQTIVNNFVSGLILLFERPLKVGDIVEVSGASGTVDRIGIRATVIRTGVGAEIIMPNGKLISEQMTNWTLTTRRRAVNLPVGVGKTSDPQKVIAILERVARASAEVLPEPAPVALFVGFGGTTLNFELHAWVDHAEAEGRVRSDLAVAISTALAEEKIFF